jgi:hypothetical protein
MRDGLPFLFMSLLMGAGMVLVGVAISPALPKLLAQALIGVSVYLALNYVVGRSMLAEVAHLAIQVIRLPAAPQAGS